MLDRAIAEKDDLIGQLASATDQTPVGAYDHTFVVTFPYAVGRLECRNNGLIIAACV
eukprot:SAG31_NODE_2016_length_6663_cov_12.109385_3_plen_57_part_00